MKKNQDLHQLFVEELENIYSAKNQVVESLPKFINSISSKELKAALVDSLDTAQDQVDRIEEIFSLLEISPTETSCEVMECLIKESKNLLKSKSPTPTTDAAIISAAQKVAHYEIACYGTLCCFAECLNLDSEIFDLLETCLEEEKAADKKLAKIAKGTFFTTGVNEVAAELATHSTKKR